LGPCGAGGGAARRRGRGVGAGGGRGGAAGGVGARGGGGPTPPPQLRGGALLSPPRPRGVLLTGEGRELAQHARSVVKAVAVMEEAVQQRSREPVGRVVVGVPSSRVEMVTVPLIEEASDKMPLVRITVVEGMSSSILDWIARDRVDLGLAFDTSDAHGVDREPVIDEELFFVCSRNDRLVNIISADGTVPLKKLARATLILTSRDNGLRRLIDDAARRAAVELSVGIEIDVLSALCGLVQRGRGQTVLSRAALARYHGNDRLVSARVVQPRIRRTVYLCYRRNQPLGRAALATKGLLLDTVRRLAGTSPWSAA
jgi:LysR family transcriptional regulator, nitrogen assimilation regulatory protein